MQQALLTLLAFCAAISALQAQDQPYLPTALEGANWIIKDSETPHFPYISFVRRIEGDTMVNGRVYMKLYQQVIDHIRDEHTDPPLAAPYQVFPERDLIALLRDSTEERSVYGMVRNTFSGSPEFSRDTLLHDYKLVEGDTLRGYGFAGDGTAPVVSEVMEEFRFGETRRIQIGEDGSYTEGIGSKYGPTSGGTALLVGCCINGIIDYCIGDLADCQVYLTPVTELTSNQTIKTHPNPFTTQLTFLPSDHQTGNPVTVSLRDITGRLLREGKLGNGLEWNTEDLAPGLYIATFVSGTQRGTVKVVKR